jgi:hypothetical protein
MHVAITNGLSVNDRVILDKLDDSTAINCRSLVRASGRRIMKVPDRQEAATDEAFTTLAADDLAMGRLALNISWY